MKKFGILMLLWFVYSTQNAGDAVWFLNQLGDAARTAKVAEFQFKGTVTYDIYYQAAAELHLQHQAGPSNN